MYGYLFIGLIIIFIIIAVVAVVASCKSCKEGLSVYTGSRKSLLPTIVGGATLTKYSGLKDHPTVVTTLHGNSGQTIVLLHCTPFDQTVWDPFFIYIQKLERNGQKIPTVIRYDMIGHGTAWLYVEPQYNDSNVYNTKWTMPQMVDDLHELLGAYTQGPVTLVGYGMGGAVANQFAVKYPDLIERLVILQTPFYTKDETIGLEIDYSTNWIKQHPDVYYLTLPEPQINSSLCTWFQIDDPARCPQNIGQSAENKEDKTDTTEFLIAERLFREASVASNLQDDQILYATDFVGPWKTARVNFPIRILLSKNDFYTKDDSPENYQSIFAAASKDTKTYVVVGKHGFSLTHPREIFLLATGGNLEGNPFVLQTLSN